jgi:hypothetical protein
MNTNQAIHMIQDHGHKAFATADGLLVMSDAVCIDCPTWSFITFTDRDCMFEESTVFEVRDDGSVDSEAIRRWLGY